MAQWNTRNPAVKRIVQELKELQRDDDPDILAEAIEDNIFEWHFVIRGAWDSEFEGGIYHGRILMPAEYPFKPPAFVMLTPSGRFETGVKICLSISSHHPESWQPSWSVRSALVALIAFMQTPGNGALGSLDHPVDARRQMAAESRTRPPAYGSRERQELIADMHGRMLEMEERSRQQCRAERQPGTADGGSEAATAAVAAAVAGVEAPAELVPEPQQEPAAPATTAAPTAPPAAEAEDKASSTPMAAAAPTQAAATDTSAAAAAAASLPAAPPTPLEAELRQRPVAAAVVPAHPVPVATAPAPAVVRGGGGGGGGGAHHSWEDRGLTYLAVLLALCIAALVIRKVLVAFTFQSDDLYTFNHVEGVEL